MTKSAPPPRNRVCLDGGLQSAVTNDGSVGECVDALQREVARLRDHLREGSPSVSVVSERVSVRDAVSGYAKRRHNLVRVQDDNLSVATVVPAKGASLKGVLDASPASHLKA